MKAKARILKRSTLNAQVQPGCGITSNEQARWIKTSSPSRRSYEPEAGSMPSHSAKPHFNAPRRGLF